VAVIHSAVCYPHQQKIAKYCFAASSRGFEYETCTVHCCTDRLVFYCVLLYEHIKDNNKDVIRNPV